MNLLERLIRKKEPEPFVPNEIQNQIIHQLVQWKMDGVPYADRITIRNAVEEQRGDILLLVGDLQVLVKYGALLKEEGGYSDERIPLPQIPPLESGKDIDFYFSVTSTGSRMRVPAEEKDAVSPSLGGEFAHGEIIELNPSQ